MKDRVENFLKVARERYGDDNDMRRELRYLLDGLANLVHENTDLLITLKAEWTKIEMDYQVSQWDERFLKAVANDIEDVEDFSNFGRAPIKAQGQPITYPTTTGTSTVTLGGAGTGATWSNVVATEKQLEELKEAFRKYKEEKE